MEILLVSSARYQTVYLPTETVDAQKGLHPSLCASACYNKDRAEIILNNQVFKAYINKGILQMVKDTMDLHSAIQHHPQNPFFS